MTNFGPNVLYHNNGDGTFTDVTAQAGVEDDRWSTSAVFLDYDLDGEEVLIIGDTPLDIACAEEIGAKMLAVATGAYYLPELQGHSPTWAVEDLRKINAKELCR